MAQGRKPSGDLFVTEEPVATAQMIGRTTDVDELVAALEARTHRVLAEPRRTGKTSVCEATLEALRERGFYTVKVDLWQAADQLELAGALVENTIANRPKYKRWGHDLKQLGSKVASSVQIVSSSKLADEFGQEIEFAWKPQLAVLDPRRYMRFALELPQVIAEKDDARVVVFFDEFQQVRSLEDKGEKALEKLMRTVFQRSDRVSYLFAGSIEHMVRDIFSANEPLGHFGGFHQLSPISASDWARGLRGRFGQDNCTITDDGLDRLVALGELHPRATMLIAQRTHMAAVSESRYDIDGGLVAAGHSEARRQERGRHQSLIDNMRNLGGKRAGALAVKTARAIARGEGPYAGALPAQKSGIARAIRNLRDAGFIEGEGRNWKIRDPLFRLYLAELDPAV
jgi:hypothetical protein